MPNVRGAESGKVTGTPSGDKPAYYRYAAMAYASNEDLQHGIDSQDGRAVLADLPNFATGGVTVLITEDD